MNSYEEFYDFSYANNAKLIKISIKNDIFHTMRIHSESATRIDFSGGTREVEEILISKCFKLTRILWPKKQDSVKRLKIYHADSLTHLDLSELPGLVELSIVDCPNLIEIIGLPEHLKHLNIHGCPIYSIDVNNTRDSLETYNIKTELSEFQTEIKHFSQLKQVAIITNSTFNQDNNSLSCAISDCNNLQDVFIDSGSNPANITVNNCQNLLNCYLSCGKKSTLNDLEDSKKLDYFYSPNFNHIKVSNSVNNIIQKARNNYADSGEEQAKTNELKQSIYKFADTIINPKNGPDDFETIVQQNANLRERNQACVLMISLLSRPPHNLEYSMEDELNAIRYISPQGLSNLLHSHSFAMLYIDELPLSSASLESAMNARVAKNLEEEAVINWLENADQRNPNLLVLERNDLGNTNINQLVTDLNENPAMVTYQNITYKITPMHKLIIIPKRTLPLPVEHPQRFETMLTRAASVVAPIAATLGKGLPASIGQYTSSMTKLSNANSTSITSSKAANPINPSSRAANAANPMHIASSPAQRGLLTSGQQISSHKSLLFNSPEPWKQKTREDKKDVKKEAPDIWKQRVSTSDQVQPLIVSGKKAQLLNKSFPAPQQAPGDYPRQGELEKETNDNDLKSMKATTAHQQELNKSPQSQTAIETEPSSRIGTITSPQAFTQESNNVQQGKLSENIDPVTSTASALAKTQHKAEPNQADNALTEESPELWHQQGAETQVDQESPELWHQHGSEAKIGQAKMDFVQVQQPSQGKLSSVSDDDKILFSKRAVVAHEAHMTEDKKITAKAKTTRIKKAQIEPLITAASQLAQDMQKLVEATKQKSPEKSQSLAEISTQLTLALQVLEVDKPTMTHSTKSVVADNTKKLEMLAAAEKLGPIMSNLNHMFETNLSASLTQEAALFNRDDELHSAKMENERKRLIKLLQDAEKHFLPKQTEKDSNRQLSGNLFGTGFHAGIKNIRYQILKSFLDALNAHQTLSQQDIENGIKELKKDPIFKSALNKNSDVDLLRHLLIKSKVTKKHEK